MIFKITQNINFKKSKIKNLIFQKKSKVKNSKISYFKKKSKIKKSKFHFSKKVKIKKCYNISKQFIILYF